MSAMWRREDSGRAFRIGLAGTAGGVLVLLAFFAVYSVRQVLVLAIIALFVAVSLEPPVRGLTRRGLPRWLAVTIVLIGLILLVAGFIAAVVPAIVGQSGELIHNLPGYIETAREKSQTIKIFGEKMPIAEKATTWLADLPARIGNSLLHFAGRFLGVLSSTLLVIVLAAYFIGDLPRLRRSAVRLAPEQYRDRARTVVDIVVDKVGSYMIGNLIISLIAGVFSLAAFLLLDIPYAVPLAVVVAVLDIVPLVGASIGAVFCVVIAALTVDIWPNAVLLAAFFIAYQQVENYWIAPRVLRSSVDLPAVAVLLAGLLGATVLGLVGALMAIPIAATIRILMSPDLRRQHAERLAGESEDIYSDDEPGGDGAAAPQSA
jgi:predicted PurR-regulated permease PerM